MEAIKEFLNISSGYGSGSGSGYGYGSGSGYGSGYGSGSGYCSGSGYGDGSGSGISEFAGQAVYVIDGVQTIIDNVREHLAKGKILNGDLTTTPCFIWKQDNLFAHGATPHEAREAALEKAFDDMPEEERLAAFVKEHEPGHVYPNTDFFAWHHSLTGSCLMGRRQFAEENGIDVENGTMTPEEFIVLTWSAYGSSTIRKLAEFYPTIKGGGCLG